MKKIDRRVQDSAPTGSLGPFPAASRRTGKSAPKPERARPPAAALRPLERPKQYKSDVVSDRKVRTHGYRSK